MQPETLPTLLTERVRKTPDAIAFCAMVGADPGASVTWSQFAHAANAVASALSGGGLVPGDRVGILAPSCVEWEYVQMGALRLGAVVVGIDHNYPDDTLRAVVDCAKLSAMALSDRATLERVPSELLRSLRCVMTLDTAGPSEDGGLHIGDALAGPPLRPSLHLPGAADTAIVVFSSGTTGRPKPIAYTHGQVVAAVYAIANAFPGIEEGAGSLVCWLPLANLFQRILNFRAVARGATSYVVTDSRNVMQALPAPNTRWLH